MTGPLNAITTALSVFMGNLIGEYDFGFEIDHETGDVTVETYSEDGAEILSRTLVRLSTVEMCKLPTEGQADND